MTYAMTYGLVALGLTGIVACVAIVAIVFGRKFHSSVNSQGVDVDIDR